MKKLRNALRKWNRKVHHLWQPLGLFFVPSRQERILGDVAVELESPFSVEIKNNVSGRSQLIALNLHRAHRINGG